MYNLYFHTWRGDLLCVFPLLPLETPPPAFHLKCSFKGWDEPVNNTSVPEFNPNLKGKFIESIITSESILRILLPWSCYWFWEALWTPGPDFFLCCTVASHFFVFWSGPVWAVLLKWVINPVVLMFNFFKISCLNYLQLFQFPMTLGIPWEQLKTLAQSLLQNRLSY